MTMDRYTFKKATEDWEFEEIHRLNYRTFVEEIPQHERNDAHRLVDKFHDKNTYLIALAGEELAGMMAVSTRRPFSLDEKMDDLDDYIPAGRNLAEVRLLAIDPEHRNRKILTGLLRLLYNYCIEQGIDMAVISGTVREKKLYARMGFTPFGPLVGSGTALYQPMYVTIETFCQYLPQDSGTSSRKTIPEIMNLLPGPVRINDDVLKVFGSAPVSHRNPKFLEAVAETKDLLCKLSKAGHVELMQGGGTLANDVVSLQLRALYSPGLVLSSGEFGERLVEQCRRAGLKHEVLRKGWGEPFDRNEIVDALSRLADCGWIWSVHCESSTGVLNDLEMLKDVAREHGVKLCMDCTSTIGTVDLDLRDVYLSTGSSGKGLAALPGLALVFSSDAERPMLGDVPRCLDLGYYIKKDGMPFTLSSNLVLALRASLRSKSWPLRYRDIKHEMADIRAMARQYGLRVIADDQCASPAILTIELPESVDSLEIADKLEQRGYLLSSQSEYLVARNWIQICLMGDSLSGDFEKVIYYLANPAKIDEDSRSN